MSVSLVPPHARWAFPAGNASLNQYQFCALNSTGQLITPAATGVFAVVLDDAPSLQASSTIGSETTGGEPSGGYTVGRNYTCVLPTGVVQKVKTGANLTPGVAVMSDTSGHAVAAVTGAVILGFTIASSTSGDIAYVLLNASAHY